MSNTLAPPHGALKRQYTGLSDSFMNGNDRM